MRVPGRRAMLPGEVSRMTHRASSAARPSVVPAGARRAAAAALRAAAVLALLAYARAAEAQFEATEVSGPGSTTPMLLVKGAADTIAFRFEDLAPTVPGVTYN